MLVDCITSSFNLLLELSVILKCRLCTSLSCSLQVSIWAPSLGFTLLFGSLIVKTWRIYYIFGKITARGFNKAKFKVKACSSSGLRELGGNPHTEEAREKR